MDTAGHVEVVVIGRGLIGTAAARHLGEAGVSTALIGPREPDDFADPTEPLASHYDQARITRIADPDPVWADLAAASLGRYNDITSRSGIVFHEPAGVIQASAQPSEDAQSAVTRGGSARVVNTTWILATYGIRLPEDSGVFFESDMAGVINPRKLVLAQVTLAEAAGVLVVDQAVRSIRRSGQRFEITAGPESAPVRVTADHVLLATGAYGATLAGVELALERRLRTVVTAELSAGPALPCLIAPHPEASAIERLYWTPPVRYPDGRMRLKVGGSVLPLQTAQTDQDIADWFHKGGSLSEADTLIEALRALLPEREIVSSDRHPCVMAYTPNHLPFVGLIDEGMAVALGGNGSAAKSSDEIGRLAASLFCPSLAMPGQVDLADLAPAIRPSNMRQT